MPQKVIRYTRALSRWIKAGRPVRTETAIIDIFRNDCYPCVSYDKRTLSCRQCGCHVNELTIAPLNKIAMQTEHCPLEKW
ncbi:MAG: hypothetical protein FWH27_15355 [Planctomycetaceae bacterium]|nr:hypothetical protein [Planctomycetaceae bacterium]